MTVLDNTFGPSSPPNIYLLTKKISDRSARLGSRPIALFLGAGADISSGGVTFTQFKRMALEDILQERLFSITSGEEVDQKFEQLFAADMSLHDRSLLVEKVYRKMTDLQPSDAYKLLVLLTEAGGIDAVLTTNFDAMLESAEALLGCDVFQIFAAGVARPYKIVESTWQYGKKPYVKLHGDLRSRSLSHLTAQELQAGNYERSLIDLLRQIVSTHDLVFAGYSGFDPALANIIADATSNDASTLFWCGPTPPNPRSPLYQRLSERLRIIIAPFDEFIAAIAKPVLERPRYSVRKPAYIRRLLDWRVEHCNQTFFSDYGQRSTTAAALTAHRPLVEMAVRSFLDSDRPLAIVSGASGFGKTTLGVRLYDTWRDHHSRKVILLTSKSLTNPEIEFHLAERLGGLGSANPLSAASLESWLRENQVQLLVFVDAINEFSTELNDCVRLLRNIVRLCYYLPERKSAIRILVTIRQETWSAILPRLDSGALRQSLWSASDIADTVEAVPIGPLADDELRDAIDRIRRVHGLDIRFDDLSPMALERLRDPFLLAAVTTAGAVSKLSGPTSSIYKIVYDSMLANNGAGIDAATLEDTLAHLALMALNNGNDFFRPVDIVPGAIRGALQRAALDLGILSIAPDGYLRFRHDRLYEYFLSIGLNLAEAPRLSTIEQLKNYLYATRQNAKARAAARIFFAIETGNRFALIEEAMVIRQDQTEDLGDDEKEMIFSFAREVIYELSESNPALAARYFRSGIQASIAGRVDRAHLRTLVQSAASLPDDTAIPTLTIVRRTKDDLATTEADIYLVDKLLRRYLRDGCPPIDFLTSSPYNIYFGESGAPPWRRLGRVLRLLGRAGPDNLHSAEYAAILAAASPTFAGTLKEEWSEVELREFVQYCRANCDRLLFNATSEDLRDFFTNPDRVGFETVLRDLEDGKILQPRHFEILDPFIQSMDFILRPMNVEFSFCTMAFILSGFNDLGSTLNLWESKFSLFTDNTPPTEVDFYQGILVFLHTLFAIPYDSRFADYEEKILRDWPTILKCRPGLARGYNRGFRDEFDMTFEDGFGVIYPYGVLRPSQTRKGLRFREYQRSFDFSSQNYPLPMYTQYLRRFLSEGRIDEAVQLLQGLNEVIVTWPMEGLATLRDAIGHSDPTVHRAVVRVLAEAYNRHPGDTVRFLRASGSALDDNDLQEIKIRQDPRIGRRQVSQQEWSRMGHHLLANRKAVGKLFEAVRLFITADNFEDAVSRVVSALGLYSGALR